MTSVAEGGELEGVRDSDRGMGFSLMCTGGSGGGRFAVLGEGGW